MIHYHNIPVGEDNRLRVPIQAIGGPLAAKAWAQQVISPLTGAIGQPHDYKRTVRIGEVEFLGCWPCDPAHDTDGYLTLVFDRAVPVRQDPPACAHKRWYWRDQECKLVRCSTCCREGMWQAPDRIDWVGDQRPGIALLANCWYRARNGGWIHTLDELCSRKLVWAKRYLPEGQPFDGQDRDGVYGMQDGAFGELHEWEAVASMLDVPEVVWFHALPKDLRPKVDKPKPAPAQGGDPFAEVDGLRHVVKLLPVGAFYKGSSGGWYFRRKPGLPWDGPYDSAGDAQLAMDREIAKEA